MAPPKKIPQTCSIEDCNRIAKTRTYCTVHYQHFRRYGDPLKWERQMVHEGCSVDGCERPYQCKGYCSLHYSRLRKWGDVHYVGSKRIEDPCSIEGCENAYFASGYCNKHYQWLKRYGDLLREPQPFTNTQIKRSLDDPDFVIFFWSKAALTADDTRCWEWQHGCTDFGYGQIRINGKPTTAHRVAWEIANRRSPILQVLHTCDNPKCINPNHLYEGTQADNIRDAVERNRLNPPMGMSNGHSNLTDEQVREVKRLALQGMKQCDITRTTHISSGRVHAIVSGKQWKHIHI